MKKIILFIIAFSITYGWLYFNKDYNLNNILSGVERYDNNKQNNNINVSGSTLNDKKKLSKKLPNDTPESIDSSIIEIAPNTDKDPILTPKLPVETSPKDSTGQSISNTLSVAQPATNSGFTAAEQELLNLVNQARARVGAKPVSYDMPTVRVARLKSEDMNKKNYFDHTSPTYGSPFDMLKKCGVSYRTAGENIAAGQTNLKAAFTSWMNSPGHKKNIENRSFTLMGIGIARHPQYRVCYTQMFIGK